MVKFTKLLYKIFFFQLEKKDWKDNNNIHVQCI